MEQLEKATLLWGRVDREMRHSKRRALVTFWGCHCCCVIQGQTKAGQARTGELEGKCWGASA